MIKFTAPEDRVIRVNDRVNDSLTGREQELLSLLGEDPGYTVTQLSERLAISRKTVAECLKKLKDDGLIRRIGSARKGHWEYVGDITKQNAAQEERGVRVTNQVTEKVTEQVTEKEQKLLSLLTKAPCSTMPQLAEQLSVSRKTVAVWLKKLKDDGLIRRIGSARKGHWEYVEDITKQNAAQEEKGVRVTNQVTNQVTKK